MLGAAEEIVGGSVFDEVAMLHDGDGVSGLVAGLGDDGEVMRDEQHGERMRDRLVPVAILHGLPIGTQPADVDLAVIARPVQEARLALWEQTVIPLVESTLSAMSRWLEPMYGDGMLELKPDLSGIPALAGRNQVIWDRVEKAGFLTPNEKRAAVGYAPLDIPAASAAKRAPRIGASRAARAAGAPAPALIA